MRLYATVTSERATKGQGGRNLVIDITGENGLKLWTIEVNPTGLNAKDYSLLVQRTKYNPLYCFDDRLNEKGEKQKGGNCWRCNENGTGSDNKYCGTCSGFGVIQ